MTVVVEKCIFNDSKVEKKTLSFSTGVVFAPERI